MGIFAASVSAALGPVIDAGQGTFYDQVVQAASPRSEGLGASFGSVIEAGLDRLNDVRYIGRQLGAGTFLSVFLRAFHFLLDPKLKGPSKREATALDRRYRAL